ncbi:MAG: hypothetical protein WD069_09090 [Planctomycetales bacterium]
MTAAALGLWILLGGPAWMLAGSAGLLGLTISGLLCLVPGWLTLCLASSGRGSAAPVAMILAATVLRMLVVLAGVLAMRAALPRLGFREFIVWLLAYYLGMLLVETLMIVRPPFGNSCSNDPARLAR